MILRGLLALALDGAHRTLGGSGSGRFMHVVEKKIDIRVCAAGSARMAASTNGTSRTSRAEHGSHGDRRRYWAEPGKTRPRGGLLGVYHSELAEWALSVYKLLIARKKLRKPEATI
jgi:hypothetical protein